MLAAACSGACSTTATVYRTNGPPVEATIEESDAHALYLRDENGNRFSLGQYEISKIDHPGNVAAAIGLPFFVFGVSLVGPLNSAAARPDADGMLGIGSTMVWTSILIGAPLLLVNMPLWLRSRIRAHDFESARPPSWMVPSAPFW